MTKISNQYSLTNVLFADTTNGRVGVGTTSPLSSLQVNGQTRQVYSKAFSSNPLDTDGYSGHVIVNSNNTNGNLSGIGMFTNNSYTAAAGIFAIQESSTAAGLVFYTGSNAAAERMRITSAGNVGIGTSSPAVRLDLTGTDDVDSSIFFRVYSNNRTVWTGLGYRRIETNSELYIIANDSTIFRNSGSERMRITSAGNVGIGTTSPTANFRLQVVSSYDGVSVISSDSSQALRISSSTNHNTIFRINNFNNNFYDIQNQPSDNSLVFDYNDNERMRITSGGDVLVGTSSLNAVGRFNSYTNGAAPAGRFVGGPSNPDGNIVLMVDKYSGTTSTSQWFLGFTISNQAAASGVITANGASQAAFGSWSDYRLKENITDLPSQLPNILALRPVEFDYIESEGGGHQISFIAQEFEQVFPDAVGERQDGMKTLTGWGKTEAILVKAIQELSADLTSAKQEIELLKAKA